MTHPTLQFLMTMWEGGGTGPPELGVAKRLVASGHRVHVLGDPTIEASARAAGCTFSPWQRAPHRTSLDPAEDLLKDWETTNPIAMLQRVRDRFLAGPVADFAADTSATIDAIRPDAVIADYLLFGSVLAAQAAGLPGCGARAQHLDDPDTRRSIRRTWFPSGEDRPRSRTGRGVARRRQPPVQTRAADAQRDPCRTRARPRGVVLRPGARCRPHPRALQRDVRLRRAVRSEQRPLSRPGARRTRMGRTMDTAVARHLHRPARPRRLQLDVSAARSAPPAGRRRAVVAAGARRGDPRPDARRQHRSVDRQRGRWSGPHPTTRSSPTPRWSSATAGTGRR